MRTNLYKLCLLLAWLSYGLFAASPAAAQELAPLCDFSSITVQASTNFSNVLKILCDFHEDGSFNDSILILDRDNDFTMPEALTLEAFDAEDDIWVYDYENDSYFEVIIDFQKTSSGLLARIYDRSEYLDSENVDTIPTAIKFRNPVAIFNAPDGWWQRGEIINFNLDIAIDGQIVAVFISPDHLPTMGVYHDGRIDYDIRIRDVDGDGHPEYDWRDAHFESPFQNNLLTDAGTNLVVNTADDQPLVRPRLLWPFIATESLGFASIENERQGQSPLQVDWERGLVTYFAEVVASRADENQWFLYSFNPILPGVVNDLNFENPFAWYDLAADNDNFAELSIRSVYTPPNDPYFRNGRINEPFLDLRYSWDQNNDNFWDYKFGGRARYEIDNPIYLEALDITLNSFAYEDLPDWAVAQSWDMVSFAAADDLIVSGEGIYEADFPPEINRFYMDGANSPIPVDETGRPMWEIFNFPYLEQTSIVDTGMRVEYSFEHLDNVMLYISPIDHKLHLMNANISVRGIDEDEEVWSYDSDNDNYLDTWLYFREHEQIASLIQSDDFLLYSSADELVLKQNPRGAPLYLTQPPRNHEEWQTLGATLASYAADFDTGNFESMLNQYPGNSWRLRNARLLDFRYVNAKWQFVIEADSNLRENNTGFELPGMSTLEASSSYMIEASAGELNIQALSEIEPLEGLSYSLQNLGTGMTVLEPVDLELSISNESQQALYGFEANLIAEYTGENVLTETRHIVKAVQLDIAPNSTETVLISWMPPLAGDWELSLHVDGVLAPYFDGLGNPQAGIELGNYAVGSNESADDFFYRLSLANQLPASGTYVLFAFLGIIIAALAVLQLLGANGDESA